MFHFGLKLRFKFIIVVIVVAMIIRLTHFARFFEKFEAEVHRSKFKCNLLYLMEKSKQ